MTIASILGGKGREVVSVASTESVTRAVALLAEHRIGALPVIDDGVVVGVFSERDVIRCVAGGSMDALDRAVSTAMTAPAVTAAPGDSVLAALSLMTHRRIRHLPVVDGSAVVGIVSIGDLVKYRIDRIEAEAAALRDYIAQ